MNLIAGVDVGNRNTEIVIARSDSDGLTPVWHGYLPTSGRKGSAASLLNAANLLQRGERELGGQVTLVALSELRPVDTKSVPLKAVALGPLPVRSLCRGANGSPAGFGMAVGAHIPLDELVHEALAQDVVVSVPGTVDFEEAATQINAGWQRGWKIVGVLAAQDDAVLIHHRITFDVPIVDEVDLNQLERGARVALEVVAPGMLRRVLADPLAVAAALNLEDDNQPGIARVTRELADAPALALTPHRAHEVSADLEDLDFVECVTGGDARRLSISESAVVLATQAPGTIRSVRVGALFGDEEVATADAFVVDLASVDNGAWLRRNTATLDQTLLALLSRDALVDAASELREMIDRNVITVADEPTAAALGASSTPAFPNDAAVCDVGAGTVDCIWEGHAVTAAGGGDIVTLAMSAALDMPVALAERVKRTASIRMEGPYLAHQEDGRRTFLATAARSEAVGRLCVHDEGTLLPFSDRLAPEEWRSLRLAIKQATVATNVARCLAALPGLPSVVVMAGGGALDDELIRSVTERLRQQGIVVGRANVAGQFGPRFAVAWGLVQLGAAQALDVTTSSPTRP